MGFGKEFISDLIDRVLANPFFGRSLTSRNLFEGGQDSPKKFLWLI
jgi:hypothetical protein